ncbi:MAG TPA: ABC transporter permease subunit, partial [Candidatus Angelobacter sp.]|nr:ABC transporter permease subunit [Candidatus Angelobacter sp.]
AFLVYVAEAAHGLAGSLARLQATPISLDPRALVHYAARTGLRMLLAMFASLIFTFTYATLAAKNRRAEVLLVPLLDILQSVPILGFSITIVFFLSLMPGRVAGAEMAAIFLIFTSQAWNMAFSFYQGLRTLPKDLDEAARSFRLSAWLRFWRVEVPFAMPGLVWNMMMSMSGGWFFVVAAEAISVGHTTIRLPGIGSYIALAIERQDLAAIGWAVLTMLGVILLYDQLLFRPLVAWSERFRFEQSAGEAAPSSWVLIVLRRARLIQALATLPRRLARLTAAAATTPPRARRAAANGAGRELIGKAVWYALIAAGIAYVVWRVTTFLAGGLGTGDLVDAGLAGLATFVRVAVLIALASAVWVPVGVWIGLRPRLARAAQPIAQFLAAFPANLLFPIAVFAIHRFALDPDIWLSPLMVLGTQWYILFNVIAGASAFPTDLRYAAANLGVRGWQWWRRVILPGIFPYYLTGAITATGGSWNASVVAEYVSWGDSKLAAYGLGAYIAKATETGDYSRIVLGIAVMSVFVILCNRLLWRPLYLFAERRLTLD